MHNAVTRAYVAWALVFSLTQILKKKKKNVCRDVGNRGTDSILLPAYTRRSGLAYRIMKHRWSSP